MDSGIYYFLIVGFSWLFLIWMLVVLFISVDQFQNQHTKLNTSLFALSCVLIFATITFNHYQMNKLQLITFNLSSILIGLLLLLLIFVNSYSEKKPIQFKNGEFNFYL